MIVKQHDSESATSLMPASWKPHDTESATSLLGASCIIVSQRSSMIVKPHDTESATSLIAASYKPIGSELHYSEPPATSLIPASW